METASDVLASNKAFYDAFERLDLDAMSRVWATTAPTSCVHPGWALVHGRERVLASWEGIFKGTERVKLSLHESKAFVSGDMGWVVLVEELEVAQQGQLVRAFAQTTNTFVREDGEWRLVHHHASPTPAPMPKKRPTTLH